MNIVQEWSKLVLSVLFKVSGVTIGLVLLVFTGYLFYGLFDLVMQQEWWTLFQNLFIVVILVSLLVGTFLFFLFQTADDEIEKARIVQKLMSYNSNQPELNYDERIAIGTILMKLPRKNITRDKIMDKAENTIKVYE